MSKHLGFLCWSFGHKRSDFLMPYDCIRCDGEKATPCVGIDRCTYSSKCVAHKVTGGEEVTYKHRWIKITVVATIAPLLGWVFGHLVLSLLSLKAMDCPCDPQHGLWAPNAGIWTFAVGGLGYNLTDRKSKVAGRWNLSTIFGPIQYAIPKEGEHTTLSCWIGRHWWSLIRKTPNGIVVAIGCPVCHKILSVHDIQQGKANP